MEKTVIVMPVANEEATMESVLTKIMELPYDNLYVYPVIDFFSKDRTEEIIRNMEKKYDRIKLIFHAQSKGVITCYLYGFKMALSDGAGRIIEMDGGGSHRPEDIHRFIEKLDEGYDCVWGSRFIEGGDIKSHPLYRRILSSGGTVLSNLVLGTRLKDMTSGFEGFKREVLEAMDLDAFLSRGHMYQTEMRFYCRKLNTVEVPITYVGSKSSIKLKSVTEALKLLFMLKNNEKNVWKREL
ncbi:MAG: glycosyltransferase [Lachnospiraceae bacterium]|nr:glycosyltransferase [Lachnospiraceae bacterium]